MHFSMVDTIEQNVEQVTINVDEGNRQLEKGVMYKVRERERETTVHFTSTLTNSYRHCRNALDVFSAPLPSSFL